MVAEASGETAVSIKNNTALPGTGLDPSFQLELPEDEIDAETSLKTEFLTPSSQLSWDLLDLMQVTPDVDVTKLSQNLVTIPKSAGRTSFRFKRHGISGSITGYKEETKRSDIDNANSGNSLSITRKYTSKNDSLKGKTTFLPFQPGGLMTQTAAKDESAFLHRNDLGLFDIPQGFERGLVIAGESDKKEVSAQLQELDDKSNEDIHGKDDEEPSAGGTKLIVEEEGEVEEVIPREDEDLDDIDDIIPMNYSAIREKMKNESERKKTWAHVVDLSHRVDNFKDVVPNMAREWPFELDTFQQEAVYHFEQGDSVFVAAHTSAGKTVVAEYAIAMATRNMTKAIYTSPIKALSNQKFRDFKETFKDIDVGLITGDVQINPDANCLIMTTEILRSMLYRGADLIRDVEFVIFDEVHYVNDIDRGVVWEEVIIMLPDHVKYILLSATVPNTFEFANWVGRTKQKDIYVISTPKRPVPLEILIWAKQHLYKVVDAQRNFSDLEFRKHKEALESGKNKGRPNVVLGPGSRGGRGGTARGGNRGGGRGGGGSGRGGSNGGQVSTRPSGRAGFSRDGPNKNTWLQLVQYLKQHNLLPAVVFVFSKKRCEEYADTLSSVDFCTAKEKSEIHMFVDRAVSRLKKEDRELPQILKIRDLLSRGIAVHHGGLLPIVKECIEILFSRTLVKVLFATETFAMGLNLPTRTVVFNQLRKHDGRGFRNLLPGEFTQMSGRAGRRGLDDTGTVIVMSYNEPLSPMDFKEVALGVPTKLLSQFRLTYNMILNLLRIEALRVEEMIKHSFSENSTQSLLPEHQKTVEKLSKELQTVHLEPCSVCNLEFTEETYDLMKEYEHVYGEILRNVQQLPLLKNNYLRAGRLFCFRDEETRQRVGFLVRVSMDNDSVLLLTFDHGDNQDDVSKLPYIATKDYLQHYFGQITFNGSFKVVAVPIDKVNFIGQKMVKIYMKDLIHGNKNEIAHASAQVKTLLRFQTAWRELSFDLAVQISLHELLVRKREIVEKISILRSYECPNFALHYKQLSQQDELKTQISSLQRLISDENLELLPDYEQRLRVLETLGFIDANHNVGLKGRVGCEINSGWELAITELILDNFLGDFEPEEIVALLSCFVYEGKTNDEEDPPLTPRLERGKQKIMDISKHVLDVCSDNQIALTSEETEFLERKRFALMNVVYEWARGLSFNEIMQMSTEAEGTIVRVITRLDEICRQVKSAALIVGDSTLHSKMSEAQERIKRDIVFCASLYL